MEGLIEEGNSILEETVSGAVWGTAIISASQNISIMITSHGALVDFAQTKLSGN